MVGFIDNKNKNKIARQHNNSIKPGDRVKINLVQEIYIFILFDNLVLYYIIKSFF